MVKNENIHIDAETNNLVIIDPNKVDENGVVKDRYINQDELQMFANLEVDVKPRSVIYSEEKNNSLRQLVATGKVDFMAPNGGNPLDTSWTDDFTGGVNDKRIKEDVDGQPLKREYQTGYVDYAYDFENEYDTQLLGIKDISVETKPTNLATSVVKIRMVDIRGRALMEKGNNSLYAVFFNLPYPIFYLTLKGYIGEAITYQLVLRSDVKIEFDADGDYYLVAEFLTVSQKLLNDIPLKLVDRITEVGNNELFDEDGNLTTQQNTRQILRSVYQRYVDGGYIDQDVLDKTYSIQELVFNTKRINETIEDDIFTTADINFFSDLAEYQQALESLIGAVNTWVNQYTLFENPLSDQSGVIYFNVKDIQGVNHFDPNDATSIIYIVNQYIKTLKNNKYLGENSQNSITLKINDQNEKVEFNSINLQNINGEDLIYGNNQGITVQEFERKIDLIIDEYQNQVTNIKEKISDLLIQVQQNTLGFKPTLRNVMGVILANIETFLILLEDTSKSVVNLSESHKQTRLNSLNITNDSGIEVDDQVYPFPAIYKKNNKDNQVEETYPADKDIRLQTKGHNNLIWPEVKLVKDYVNSYLKENSQRTNESQILPLNLKSLLPIDSNNLQNNFSERTYIDILYKIYNRALYVSSTIDLPPEYNQLISSLGKKDADNFIEMMEFLTSNKDLLKRNNITLNTLLENPNYLAKDFNRIEDAKEFAFTNTNISNSIEKTLLENGGITILNNISSTDEYLSKINKKLGDLYLNKNFNRVIYPFNKNQPASENIEVRSDGQIYTKSDYDFINNVPNTIINTSLGKINVLNHRLFNDDSIIPEDSNDLYKTRAFVFLNSLDLRNLNDDVNKTKYYTGFNINSIKETKTVQILRWGSIWYRYKRYINDNYDILSPFLSNLTSPVDVYDNDEFTLSGVTAPVVSSVLNNAYDFKYNHLTEDKIDVGFYPHIIINIYNKLTNQNLTINDTQKLYDEGVIELEYLGFNDVSNDVDYIRTNLWNVKLKINGKYVRVPTYYKPQAPETTLTQLLNNSFVIDEDSFKTIDYFILNQLLPNQVEHTDYFIQSNDKSINGGDISDLLGSFDTETLDYFESLFIKFAGEPGIGVTYKFTDFYEEYLNKSVNDISNIKNLTRIIRYVKNNPYDVHPQTMYILNRGGRTNLGFFDENDVDENQLEKDIELIWGIHKNDEKAFSLAKSFYRDFDIEYNPNTFKYYRGIVRRWISYFENNEETDNNLILNYLTQLSIYTDNIIERVNAFVTGLFEVVNRDLNFKPKIEEETTPSQISNTEIEKKIYRSLKVINDTWTNAWDFKQISIASLFQYVDQINRPIGDKFYVDIESLTWYYNERNIEQLSIGQFISGFLKRNNLSEPISLGGNVNFYSENTLSLDNQSNDDLIDDSRSIANRIFGLHSEVKKNGAPKFIIYQRSHESEVLNLNVKKFANKTDGFSISIPNNPIANVQLDDGGRQKRFGNRSIGFYVDFGIQNQGIFKDFTISSYDGVRTQEELVILENIATRKNSSQSSTFGTGLLDILKSRTYSCKIRMIGNTMIQPFMYFDLRYIPIFSGTYLILSVSHDTTSDNGIMTEFEGVRVSKYGTPSATDYLAKSKYNLLDGLIKSINDRKKKRSVGGSDTFEPITITPNIVKLPKLNDVGQFDFGDDEQLEAVQILSDRYDINTPLRLAHFLGQTDKESDGFKSTVVNLNFTTVNRLREVFPSSFKDKSDSFVSGFTRNPEKLANLVYANRGGNGDEDSGDGWKYRERGYIQLFGKNNQREFSEFMTFNGYADENIFENPDLIAEKYPLDSAGWFWKKNGLNEIADEGSTIQVTKKITKKVRGIFDTFEDRHKLFKKYFKQLT